MRDLYGIRPTVSPQPAERVDSALASGERPGDTALPVAVSGVIRLFDVATGQFEYAGVAEDPEHRPMVRRLLAATLDLSPDDQETLWRVAEAMKR